MSGCESDYLLFIIKINKNDLSTLFNKETAFLKPYFPGHVIKNKNSTSNKNSSIRIKMGKPFNKEIWGQE